MKNDKTAKNQLTIHEMVASDLQELKTNTAWFLIVLGGWESAASIKKSHIEFTYLWQTLCAEQIGQLCQYLKIGFDVDFIQTRIWKNIPARFQFVILSRAIAAIEEAQIVWGNDERIKAGLDIFDIKSAAAWG